MEKFEIAKRIADNHNRVAEILSSGDMTLLSADSVVLMGDTIKDLRALAHQIMIEVEAEKASQYEKEEIRKEK